MRKLFAICATLGALSGLAMADTWTGTLMDAHCANRSGDQACYAKRSSVRYVLDVNGTKYRLDAHTNRDVRSALLERKHSMKSDPSMVTIEGQLRSDGSIHAHTIGLQ
jgi:hypothetical protein